MLGHTPSFNLPKFSIFRPIEVKSIDSGSTADTPDIEENENLTEPIKNHSFSCENNGLPPLIKINDEPIKPFALQMGNGNSSDGKYSQVARMALSHPVLPSFDVNKAHTRNNSHRQI